MKKPNYTKSALVKELAQMAGLSQRKTATLLETLTQIAYREAAGESGFTLPGLCRMDVIKRKARRARNPQTGENILIAEHDALRVRVLKKARDAVTPTPENFITVLEAPPVVLDDFSQAISFRCKKCGQEIEAPAAAIGMQAECPACGSPVAIPPESELGTMHNPAPEPEQTPEPLVSATVAAAPTAPAKPAADMKSCTIRIDLAALGIEAAPKPAAAQKRMLSFFCKNCKQEIEAAVEMAGSACECPSCGSTFEIPFFSDPGTLHGADLEKKAMDAEVIREMKSRTIRIELPDDM